ncbi:energy-coupling factor transport system substrate-specific component [Halobacillus alkaliphilus]|uniref:Energy-coupling factor transport system substrate-specific component n=1 Tax=Halobacillus alkaliphilus TaxID=396056 RepID=A0A1I2K8A9_9BACI|nr:ECF transporter S component [Halobacillus alkaliphilus]SFF62430.1 energy-coupling factor transport system substrate-specific component [Halobacillus alkaliphilus]
MNIYKITLLAMLASLAVAGRIALSHLPNVQPVTAIIILTGFWMGPAAGLIMAFLTTVVSNMLLGMGYWTIWQVVAWSIIGLFAGLIGKYKPEFPVWGLTIYGFLSGIFFGVVISLTMRSIGQPFWAYYLAGLPYDLNHAISNVIFILILSPVLGTLFRRYKQRNGLTEETAYVGTTNYRS